MAHLNRVTIQGRLTADPELKSTPNGVSVTSFALASDTGRQNGDGEKITNFIDCVAWRSTAEFVSKYFGKGRLMIADGELSTRVYTDKDGNKRKATELVVSNAYFCDSKKDNQNGQNETQQTQGAMFPNATEDFAEIGDEEDLPF